jgi:ribonuclease P protein component
MLPSQRRVTKEAWPALIKSGKVFFSPNLSLRLGLLSQPATPSLFGVVVSKKVAKTAVRRNYLKRRLRAIINKHLESFPTGYQFAFFFRQDDQQLKIIELEQETLNLLSKTKIFHA